MAIGDYEISRINIDLDTTQESDSSVVTSSPATFPTSTFDDIQYTLVYRSGGPKTSQISIMIGGARIIA